MKLKNTILILLLVQLSSLIAKDYNILHFGAKADGFTLNTQQIQKAIDQIHKEGGGRLTFSEGTFISGSIVLKSGVELYIHKGCTLKGSINPEDYQSIQRWKALVLADNATDISIKGEGVIDGNGADLALRIDSLFYAGKIDSADYNFKDKRPSATIRPQIIEFVNSENIEIVGIQLIRAASWVQSYFRCQNILIDSIYVDSDTYWNNDGIDIIDSRNVRITNSYINASDDGICLKSYHGGYRGPQNRSIMCDSIYIANCTIRSSASAIKFGTASYRGFKNILIEHILIYDTYRSAIALEAVHNGPIENVVIRDMEAKNTGNAFFIRLAGKEKKERKGYFKNVLISNLKVEVPAYSADQNYEIRGPALPFFHNTFPSSITGIPNNKISGLELENIEITYSGGGNSAYANLPLDRLDDIPEYAEKYPEFSMFGELPAWGIYMRHINGIKLKNIRLRQKKADYRPAIVMDDVEDYQLETIEVLGDKKKTKIYLKDKGPIMNY